MPDSDNTKVEHCGCTFCDRTKSEVRAVVHTSKGNLCDACYEEFGEIFEETKHGNVSQSHMVQLENLRDFFSDTCTSKDGASTEIRW